MLQSIRAATLASGGIWLVKGNEQQVDDVEMQE
jgi:hypothetical protein